MLLKVKYNTLLVILKIILILIDCIQFWILLRIVIKDLCISLFWSKSRENMFLTIGNNWSLRIFVSVSLFISLAVLIVENIYFGNKRKWVDEKCFESNQNKLKNNHCFSSPKWIFMRSLTYSFHFCLITKCVGCCPCCRSLICFLCFITPSSNNFLSKSEEILNLLALLAY